MNTLTKLKNRGKLLLLGGFIFTSCENENLEIPTSMESSASSTEETHMIEKAYPDTTGELVQIRYRGALVTVEKIANQFILGGDMIIEEDISSQAAKSTARVDRKWIDNTVYYTIADDLPSKSRVTNAIKHWEQRTNLKFIKGTNSNGYINFQKGSGCSSSVGRTGSKQAIKLADRCSTGNAIHEIGHAIGLLHEQSRSDRDDFVTIFFDNIKDGKAHNFKTWKTRGFDGANLTKSLDFGSIMMYSSKAFSKNGKATILKNNGRGYTAQRRALSDGDIEGVAKLYPFSIKDGTKVKLKGNNNRYISSENGKRQITITKNFARSWETFEIVDAGGGFYAFKGNNGKYISSEGGKKPMTCNRSRIGSWEKFKLEKQSGNKYYIRGNNNRLVSSNNGRSIGVTCDRTRKGSYELFVIEGL